MRLFIAVKVPWCAGFDRVISDISGCPLKIKWVERENTHVTLKFLGEVSEALVPEVDMALSESFKGVGAGEIVLKGVGGFPNMRRPRVLWVGIEDSGVLRTLHERVEGAMERVGFRKDKKPFKPHLTLGRVKGILSNPMICMKEVEGRWRGEVFERIKVEEVSLIESVLDRRGPTYYDVRRYRLQERS